MSMTARQQGMHAALMVIAEKCKRHIERGDAMMARHGESNALAQSHRGAVIGLRAVAEAIRVEAMLPPAAMPPVLRADYQQPSAKMDAAKVQP